MTGARPPDWQRYAPLLAPAGEPAPAAEPMLSYVNREIDWSQEVPTSFLRGAVAVTTLAVGQLALGETNHAAIARRSVAGALIGEAGVIAARVAAVVGARPVTDVGTLDGLLLYGEAEAARYAVLFARARRGELR